MVRLFLVEKVTTPFSSSAGAPQSATEREESRPLSALSPTSWGNFVGLSHMMCRLPPESNVTAYHLGLSPICDSPAVRSAHLVWCQFQGRGWSAEIQADPRLFPTRALSLTSSTIVQSSYPLLSKYETRGSVRKFWLI